MKTGGAFEIATKKATDGRWIATVNGTKAKEIVVAEAGADQLTPGDVIVVVKRAWGVKLRSKTTNVCM